MNRTVQDKLNEYWDTRSVPYDDYQYRPERYAADREAWAAIFTAALPATPADVLDVGTGTGFVSLLLADLGHRVTGTDLAGAMLDRARLRAAAMATPPRLQSGDAVAPEFPPESFDAITGRYVMWTLREPQTALRNWYRLLRPGGVLAVVDSTWFPDGIKESGAPEFTRLYDAEVREALPLATATDIEQTADLIRDAGFTAVSVTPLQRVFDLDSTYGVAEDHEVRMQHLVRAVRA